MVVDTSWIFGYVVMACFSIIVIAITIKAISYLFPKRNKDIKED